MKTISRMSVRIGNKGNSEIYATLVDGGTVIYNMEGAVITPIGYMGESEIPLRLTPRQVELMKAMERVVRATMYQAEIWYAGEDDEEDFIGTEYAGTFTGYWWDE